MVRVEGVLREFAGWLAANAPEVLCVADLRRAHIEAYKLHLSTRPSARGGRLSKTGLAEHLGTLRTCFERLTEWDGDDIPARVLMFPGDLPLRDDPLPRFLDDAAFTKLLQAARADDDPFVRLCVEFLARTGLRKGEFLNLTVDSVVQIGAAYWLHVPLGKLRTDRYIPLHPQLKDLLDTWIAARPTSLRSRYLFVEYGQRIGEGRVDRAVAKTAKVAGIGHVSPHRLRHTLATQAINRGMTLEALAALLGHRSMRMTLVYARIADRTVADEYFSVSEKVEALYNQPHTHCPPTPKALKCASSVSRCTAACSATATAPDPSAWTATSNPSANPALSSRPPSNSARPCRHNATTPPTKDNSAARKCSTDCSPDSIKPPPDKTHLTRTPA
ncbi:tyrosine-type recombinase/integrase [Mycobacterium riyadhense]|uniref:tyrosine-type recombinase/integrase n=1 Tax=Mycobacterium riyadhense TaxID=486698 RepID=UPI001EF9DDE2|nr:site-specific integrase [Mycobacterium riyadhense]